RRPPRRVRLRWGGAPPYTVEAHVADAIAVLDHAAIDRGWIVGHSWGGHLALHLAVSHPERVAGLLLIDPLGADPGIFPEADANLRRGLSDAQRERLDQIERRRREGDVSEPELIERFALVWPQFFLRPEGAPPPPARVG